MTDEFTTPIYYEDDADASKITDKTVAVIGYGSQGHAHALNLHDSGVDVVVGLREGSSSREAAREEGLRVATIGDAAEEGDIVSILIPDNTQPDHWSKIEAGLDAGDTLLFAHGFNVHYNQIVPPEDVNVIMIAPKSPGHLVRRNFVRDQGTPGLLAVYQDVTGDAHGQALAYGKGIGCARAGIIETTFKEEVESDLFGEQAVLCGGVTEMVKAGFETLVENGYSPEIAYFECLNELKLIVDLMYEGGLMNMWDSVSDTAEYGGLTRGEDVIDREALDRFLEEVQNGEFATEWVAENQANRATYHQYREAEKNHEIEEVGARLRELFAWAEAETEEETEEVRADD